MLGKDGVISTVTSESLGDSDGDSAAASAHARTESAQATPSESVFSATLGPAKKTSIRAVDRWSYQWVDKRLKVMSVAFPVIFIVGLELIRAYVGGGDDVWDRMIFLSVTIVSILVFGMVMFRFIDRAQRQVVRQNLSSRKPMLSLALYRAKSGWTGSSTWCSRAS